MMDFGPAPTRPRMRESVVPMINVVFLLLIFFLMSAQIAPPPPFDVAAPEAQSSETDPARDTLYIDADGTLAFGAARGADVWASIAENPPETLYIRADANLSAARLAAVLPDAASTGVTTLKLVTRSEDR